MTKHPDWLVYPHGTPARARWHYRQGHKPLREHCPPCADANALEKALKKEKKEKQNGQSI